MDLPPGHRLSVEDSSGRVMASGCVDPGFPTPIGIRQTLLMLPAGTAWEGLRLRAALEVKGIRYPVRWACRQGLNPDGSLSLRRNVRG